MSSTVSSYLKDKVHSRPFVSVENLKERIKLHCSNINDQLNSVKTLRNDVCEICITNAYNPKAEHLNVSCKYLNKNVKYLTKY